jgi:hypothetical protein
MNQYQFPLTVLRVWRMKTVSWRGIDYSIDDQNRLRINEFVPYREAVADTGELESAASIH